MPYSVTADRSGRVGKGMVKSEVEEGTALCRFCLKRGQSAGCVVTVTRPASRLVYRDLCLGNLLVSMLVSTECQLAPAVGENPTFQDLDPDALESASAVL